MNSRWVTLISASLVAFAIFVVTWHFVISWRFWHWKRVDYPSIAMSCIQAEQLAKIPSYVERNQPATGLGPTLDLALPKNARVFISDMTGPTNYSKIGYYYFTTYYLFPREIGVSTDQPTRITKDGFPGKTSESNQEIRAMGFDVRLDIMPDGSNVRCTMLHGLPLRKSANPDWFGSNSDAAIAFLLPLLTALAGMWLFRLLFPALSVEMPLLEQLAYGMGLGMMAVAALTLGVKLCGFSGRRLILAVTAVGAIAKMWHDRKAFLTGISGGFRKLIRHPVAIGIGVAGLLVFLILFRLAGLRGLVEFDAVAAWSLKAKILHLYNGRELVQWFSNPRLAHAHLDYPTLVPSLHAATFDSHRPCGRVCHQVLAHLDAAVSYRRSGLAELWPGKGWFYAPSLALLGLLLLPVTQNYVQYEGGTLPMVFFTVLGFVQCALWLMGKDRARLGLGLTLLFGAAMAKFEGFIFLALVGSWMLLLPSARPLLKLSPRFWPVLAFWFAGGLALCLPARPDTSFAL